MSDKNTFGAVNLPESLAANQAIFYLEKLPPGQPLRVFGNLVGTMAGNGGPSLGFRALSPTLLRTVIPGENRDFLSFRQTLWEEVQMRFGN